MATREKTEQIRQQIIQATDDLLYHKGFNLMSFSDIAEVSGVPRGNIYYHFKTKDEVLAAVIDYRVSQMRQMLKGWETRYPDPLQRLKRYARIPLEELDNLVRFGCPMGTLNAELGKSRLELQALSRGQFDLFKSWLQRQFRLLRAAENPDVLATRLLAKTQGVAMLAHVYRDKTLVRREVKEIEGWLQGLQPAE